MRQSQVGWAMAEQEDGLALAGLWVFLSLAYSSCIHNLIYKIHARIYTHTESSLLLWCRPASTLLCQSVISSPFSPTTHPPTTLKHKYMNTHAFCNIYEYMYKLKKPFGPQSWVFLALQAGINEYQFFVQLDLYNEVITQVLWLRYGCIC